MACGCKPTVTPGTCNRTIELCRYSPLTVLAVNPVCTALPYNLTVVGAIGNIIYSIVNDGKSIAINSDETTDELAYITYEYNCNGIPQTCTLTINVQDRIEGTHAIELNACSSTCSLGDTTYLWTGFTEGCVELMPGYSATDCQIKVLVYEECAENLNNVISLEVCCGACLDGCCKTTTWTWNPPTFNDNCDADCTMYPCTVYDPVTGNCVSSCEECQTCCNVGSQNSVPIAMTCIKVDEQNYTLDLNTFTLTGEWIWAKIKDVEENGNCLLVTDWKVFNTSIINKGDNKTINFIYIDNGHMQITIQTDDILDGGGAVLIGYKVGDCKRWYAFQVLALADQTPSNHCLGTFVFNEYVLEHNELADTPLPLCNTCTQSSSSYCADCCDNLGCVKENCVNQPVCSSGECKCFIGQLEVPALPNGCCPAECTEDTIIPTCSTCVSGVIIPAPVCTETFVLNTNTCLCECPSGTVFDALTMTCIQVNCNVPGQTCPPCHNCVEGVCTPISCSGVPGMVNNPIGDGTVQNPCCIPDPCPNCIASLEVNKYCTDVLPRRANVSADATNYRIKFTQIQLNYLPFYSQVDCEYEALQAITQTNNLVSGVTYQINYTNYILDWVTITPSGTTLIIPQSAGNGFLIKCNWKGREVIYEFIFEEGFNGSADQLVLGEYPIQVRKVKDLTCGNVYGLSGDCQTTYSWEFTEAALNTSGQFITDNPIVVHATGLDAEVCVNAVTQFNGIVCEETQVCADVDECQGACGCDPCNGGGTLFSTIEQVTTSDTLIFYASVFRDCGNGDELPIMFTCAPPTAVEYIAYINSGGDTLPDGCGTLPQMFDSKPACANCGTFNCSVPGTSTDPATQLCGWWLNTALLVPDSLHINGANIEFEILPAVEMIELCFGTNTECGYVCSCTIIENPEYDPEAPCNLVANVTSECTEAGYVQALAVHMTGGMGPYTIQYNVDREAVGGAHTDITAGVYVLPVPLTDYIIMGFGVDVQGGCLWYDITITDSSPIPCVVNLTACIPCDPEPCNVTAALQTSCEIIEVGVESHVIIEQLVIGGINSGTYNVTGEIGWRRCSPNVDLVRWTLNLPNQVGPNINLGNNISGNDYIELHTFGNCDYTEQCAYYDLTITDVENVSCRVTISGCINCPEPAVSFNCETGQCVDPGDGSGDYATQFECKEALCGIDVVADCAEVIETNKTPGNTSIVIYDLSATGANLTNLQTVYIDVAQGGKPEKYKVYQVKPDGTKQLVFDSPHLGCGCAASPFKSLNGFWSNLLVDPGGVHLAGTVASVLTPFEFKLTSAVTWPFTDYASVNYSTYVSGGTDQGYKHNFIPSNCTWVHELNSDCTLNPAPDYNTCNTGNCNTGALPGSGHNYEELNAKALSRFYFQYIESEGDILQIEVEHGVFESTCPVYDDLAHGIKFSLVCQETFIPEVNCTPLSGGITPGEPEEVSDKYVYTPVCANTLNHNISLGITELDEGGIPEPNNAPMFDNVVNIGYGYKYSNGKKTNEKAYIYQVNKKLDKTELASNQIIPKVINGIKTDVVELTTMDEHYYNHITTTFNRDKYLNGLAINPATGTSMAVGCSGETICYDYFIDNTDPNNLVVECGCIDKQPLGRASANHNSSIKSNDMVYGGLGVYVYQGAVRKWGGTISLVAKETSTGKLVALTNNHVLGSLTGPTHILQNTSFNYNYRLGCGTAYSGDCYVNPLSCSTVIGTDYKAVAFVLDGTTPNYVDAGLIALSVDVAATDIQEIGYGNFPWVTEDMFTNVSQLVGLTVYKSGATTGTKIAVGEISSVAYNTLVTATNKLMVNQILITPIANDNSCNGVHSLAGDSGSPVLIELYGQLYVLGIGWGGSAYFPDPTMVVSPIWEVAARAGIEAWEGEIVTTSNSPFIRLTKNERQYKKGIATNAQVTHTTFTEHNTQEEC
jgi:hypothetical protein